MVVSLLLWKIERRILSVAKNLALGRATTEEEYAYEAVYKI